MRPRRGGFGLRQRSMQHQDGPGKIHGAARIAQQACPARSAPRATCNIISKEKSSDRIEWSVLERIIS
jgi:hypothetical protein